MQKGKYAAYFDSGTSNTRIYILNDSLEQVYQAKKELGSKDSAAAGSNDILMKGLKTLYDEALNALNINDGDIESIYASGMSTSPYGIWEVPHKVLPLSVKEFASDRCFYKDEEYFKREIDLIPGLKTVGEDISLVNNVRGEEIEVIGAMDKLQELVGKDAVAVMLPGSHTHTILMEDGILKDILSTMSGEIFYALKSATILAPVLGANCPKLDMEYVKKGVSVLKEFGFNRAIYIVHAMRIFENGTETERLSFAEGVIMGGIAMALDSNLAGKWKGCTNVALIADDTMFGIFKAILEECQNVENVYQLPINDSLSYAVKGVAGLIKIKGQ